MKTKLAKKVMMTVQTPSGPITDYVIAGEPQMRRLNDGPSAMACPAITQIWCDTAGHLHFRGIGALHSIN